MRELWRYKKSKKGWGCMMSQRMRGFVVILGLWYSGTTQAVVWFMVQSTGSWLAQQGTRTITHKAIKEVAAKVTAKAAKVAAKNAITPGKAGAALRMGANYVQGAAGTVGVALDMSNLSTWVSAVKEVGILLTKLDSGKVSQSLHAATKALSDMLTAAHTMSPEQWAHAAGAGTSMACGAHQTYTALRSTFLGMQALVAELQKTPGADANELLRLQETLAALTIRIDQLQQEQLKKQTTV